HNVFELLAVLLVVEETPTDHRDSWWIGGVVAGHVGLYPTQGSKSSFRNCEARRDQRMRHHVLSQFRGFLDEIRQRLPISLVVGEHVIWDKHSQPEKGDFWACCPFHGEKSPSFHVDDRKGIYCRPTAGITWHWQGRRPH